MYCRINRNEPLVPVLDLGSQYVSDFVDKENIQKGDLFPMTVGVNPKTTLGQLFHNYPPERMYKTYWYNSSTNESMRKELKSIVDSVSDYVTLKGGDTVLDIASNSGEMLTSYPRTVNRIGIDPSDVARDSEIYKKEGIILINDYFSSSAFKARCNAKPKVISLIAMFYDLDDPIGITREIRDVIAEDGLFILQMSYTPLMLEQNGFDNIGHEHLCYYSLESLEQVLYRSGFTVVDVKLNPTNGGSFRVYCIPKERHNPSVWGYTDRYNPYDKLVCPDFIKEIYKINVDSLRKFEKDYFKDPVQVWRNFAFRVESLKKQTVQFIEDRIAEGKTVYAAGASTKGNTLLQYYGLGPQHIKGIAERQEKKVGLYTMGTGIPIISEEEMRKASPDYVLLLPWHFFDSIVNREKEMLEKGTKFIMPLPQLKVYGKDGWEELKEETKVPTGDILTKSPFILDGMGASLNTAGLQRTARS